MAASSPTLRAAQLPVWLACGAVVVAVVQYIFAITSQLAQGQIILTAADVDVLQEGGLLRFAKDGYLVLLTVLSAFQLRTLAMNAALRQLVVPYLIWLVLLLLLGMMPLTFLGDPKFYALAGIRWILLLHAGICLFAFALRYPLSGWEQKAFAYVLIAVSLADIVMIGMQSESLYDLQVGAGAARLVGFFTQAGVGGTFAIFIGLIAWSLRDIAIVQRMVLFACGIIISVAAGSRFGMICLAILLYSSVDDLLKMHRGPSAIAGRALLICLACGLTVPLYQIMAEIVDRGDLLDVQLDEGGRIANIIESWNVLSKADAFSVLFGQGLGVGTNNLMNFIRETENLTDSPINDLSFNRITDNTFLTIVFQFGVVGSIVFWGGLIAFWWRMRALIPALKRGEVVFILLVAIATVSTSLFEQYFLVIGLPLAIAFRAQPKYQAG